MSDHSMLEAVLSLRDIHAGVYFDGIPVENCVLNIVGKVFVVDEAERWLGDDYEVRYRVSLVSFENE